MGSYFVVVDHPPGGGFPYVVETDEEIEVKHFLAESAIEALNEGVLIRLAGLDVLQRYAVRLEPVGERLAQELGTIARAHDLRQTMIAFDLLEHTHQPLRVDRRVHFDLQGFSAEVVHDVDRAKTVCRRRARRS